MNKNNKIRLILSLICIIICSFRAYYYLTLNDGIIDVGVNAVSFPKDMTYELVLRTKKMMSVYAFFWICTGFFFLVIINRKPKVNYYPNRTKEARHPFLIICGGCIFLYSIIAGFTLVNNNGLDSVDFFNRFDYYLYLYLVGNLLIFLGV